jgi:hypothetical protein
MVKGVVNPLVMGVKRDQGGYLVSVLYAARLGYPIKVVVMGCIYFIILLVEGWGYNIFKNQ